MSAPTLAALETETKPNKYKQSSLSVSSCTSTTPLLEHTGSKSLTPNSGSMILPETSISQGDTTMNHTQPIVTPAPSSLPGDLRRLYPCRQKQERSEELASSSAAAVAAICPNDKRDLVRLGILYVDGGQNGHQRRLRIVTQDATRTGNRVYRKISFPNVLYDMLVEQSVSNPSVMHWIPDGTAFIVDPSHPGLSKILPQYFGRT